MKQFEPKEALSVNAMVAMNNEYVALMKQKDELENGIKNIHEELKNVRAGRGFPIIRAIGKNVFKTINKVDRKEVITEMVKQLDMMQNAVKGVEGQIKHKMDEYEGASLTVYRFLKERFKDIDEELGMPTASEMPSVNDKKRKN